MNFGWMIVQNTNRDDRMRVAEKRKIFQMIGKFNDKMIEHHILQGATRTHTHTRNLNLLFGIHIFLRMISLSQLKKKNGENAAKTTSIEGT